MTAYLPAPRSAREATAVGSPTPSRPSEPEATSKGTWRPPWRWVRRLIGVGVLAVVVARLGAGPFLDGLAAVSVWSLTAAAGVAVVTTVGSAWRWRLVCRGLSLDVPLSSAVAAYYRSQFLNTVLPGGVLGDVHRAVSHGRAVGDLGRAARAVVWERAAGQVVQVGIALVVILGLPSPVRAPIATALPLLVLAALLGVPVVWAVRRRRRASWARIDAAVRADVRDGLLARDAWPGILASSVVVIAGHTATFLLAARTAGVTAPVSQLLPLVMLVMLAMTVPTNVGGWGPREGVAAWLFAVAGLGAGLGVAAATAYGVMTLVATLPGAGVLVVVWARRGRRRSAGSLPPRGKPASGLDASRPLTPTGPSVGGVVGG